MARTSGTAPLKAVTARGMGYVPDGLNPAQYEALKKKEAAAKAANKKKAMKGLVPGLHVVGNMACTWRKSYHKTVNYFLWSNP